jgi:preprotein translocase subunit SecG
MISVVIAIHLMLVLAMIGVVLLQKSEGGGLVSSTSGFLSNRGTANVLTRATALLAAGFFVTSLVLSLLASREREPASILNPGGAPVQVPSPNTGAPMAPLSQGGNGLLNQLANPPTGNPPSPPGPASAPAPSGPQVPQSK